MKAKSSSGQLTKDIFFNEGIIDIAEGINLSKKSLPGSPPGSSSRCSSQSPENDRIPDQLRASLNEGRFSHSSSAHSLSSLDRNYSGGAFLKVTDISLRTHPSQGPPPSRPPPARPPPKFDPDERSFSRMLTDHQGYAVGSGTSYHSFKPPTFDAEMSTSSAAAASVAAMQEAMAVAQARLRSAKVSMERKKDNLQNRRKIGLSEELSSVKRDQCEIEQERQRIREEQVAAGEINSSAAALKTVKGSSPPVQTLNSEKIGSKCSPGGGKVGLSKEAGEWKVEEQFYELIQCEEKFIKIRKDCSNQEESTAKAWIDEGETKESKDTELHLDLQDREKRSATDGVLKQEGGDELQEPSLIHLDHIKHLRSKETAKNHPEKNPGEGGIQEALPRTGLETKWRASEKAFICELGEKNLKANAGLRKSRTRIAEYSEPHVEEEIKETKTTQCASEDPEDELGAKPEARSWEGDEVKPGGCDGTAEETEELCETEKELRQEAKPDASPIPGNAEPSPTVFSGAIEEADIVGEGAIKDIEAGGAEEATLSGNQCQIAGTEGESVENESAGCLVEQESEHDDAGKDLSAMKMDRDQVRNVEEKKEATIKLAEDGARVKFEAEDEAERARRRLEEEEQDRERERLEEEDERERRQLEEDRERARRLLEEKEERERRKLEEEEKERVRRSEGEKEDGERKKSEDEERARKSGGEGSKLKEETGGRKLDERASSFDEVEQEGRKPEERVRGRWKIEEEKLRFRKLEGVIEGEWRSTGEEKQRDRRRIEKEKDRERRRMEEEKESERMKMEEKERERRKLEEERDREREREKDRQAAERAAREANERAFAEARDRAEKATAERMAAEARQRALAEARERVEKASSEALEKSLVDKTAREARLRAAERAAVERATEEARERAVEKAMAEKAAQEGRVRGDKSAATTPDNHSIDNDDPHPMHFLPSIASHGFEVESAIRCKARMERHQRTVERAAKALAEKNLRDVIAQREQAERNRLAEALDAEIRRWSNGKEGNLRALLSTLQYILGPESGWQPISLTEVLTAPAVKRAYRKATLCVHPDKLQQRGASIQHKYICEKVFDLLKEAWNRFNSEER
ncbi:unnamed protein product [Spirodela intermedia]|uniref:J domain-containing protein n=1 Tax=Spirodela intermedia TaxID=51605 RepID=A0A7I8KKG6_SPIIN|nr:unnamed protein product [Spirodela intermedia]